MSQRDIVVIGGGGHAKVVIDSLRAAGLMNVCGVLDDNPARQGDNLMGVPVLGAINEVTIERLGFTHAVIAIGDNPARSEIARRFQTRLIWERVVHPRAVIGADVELGEGTVIFAGAVVQPATAIGRHVIVNTAASVDHDCMVGDFAHLAPGARLAGGVRVGEGALIGMGACVLPTRGIGEWATIGAGGIVTRDIPAHVTAIGAPAMYVHRP